MPATGRLPRTVVPRRYDLTLSVDLDASRFAGRVEIALDVLDTTGEIVLHAQDLDVELDGLEVAGLTVDPASVALRVDAHDERIVVALPEPIRPGPAALTLRFRGEISPGLFGFYRSTYVDEQGTEHVLATTQFEAPHARAAFPCFDEPEFKAVFAVTLEVDERLLAISNGPEVARDQIAGGRVRVRFGDTIPMSTYLVAWVVGPLEATEPVDAGGVAVRVVHAPGKAHLTSFAVGVASFAIQYFADYYGIPYPGEKCDLVALPDFAFGAMENLGCITFREVLLLLDPDAVTLDEMSNAALTIMHEVAHMWFGDLVTMKWWNGIWLNEAFATFMEHLATDAYRAEWRVWYDFATSRAAALDIDALSTTRTVEYEVVTPEDAEGMFDILTYQKGGSVLRMLERWLGADAFRAGVRHYLDRYQLGNTETTDLWDALEEATGQPARRIMDSWIFQPGYPVVTPERGSLTQRRFAYERARTDERWAVPVLARIHSGTSTETRSLLLDGDAVTLDGVDDGALVVLNAGGEGFYRVAYPAEWRDRLVDARVLSDLERFALVDDMWAAALAGAARVDEFLALAMRFSGERELVVWRSLLTRLRQVGRLADGPALDRLRARTATLIGPTFAELGWDARPDEDPRRRQLRGGLIDMLGSFAKDPEAIGRAREALRSDHTDPDVAAASVSVVASNGTDDDYEMFLRKTAESEGTPQEQLRYLYALGKFPSEDLVLRTARHATSDAVRKQNGPFVVRDAMRNPDHGAVVWAYVRDHWDHVFERFGGMLMTRLLEGVTWLIDDATVADIPLFLDAHPIPEGARIIAQHVERQRVHRALFDRDHEHLEAALVASAG
jgi:puromycin-sensitive aminopeptidase